MKEAMKEAMKEGRKEGRKGGREGGIEEVKAPAQGWTGASRGRSFRNR